MANVAKETYFRDLGLGQNFSRFLAVLPAIFGVLMPISDFISIISFIGTVGLAISGSIICLMVIKINPRFRVPAIIISLIFLTGALKVIFF